MVTSALLITPSPFTSPKRIFSTTVISEVVLLMPLVAVMVTVPTDTPVTTALLPLPLTVAMALLLDCQVVLPAELSTSATSEVVLLIATVANLGVMLIVGGTSPCSLRVHTKHLVLSTETEIPSRVFVILAKNSPVSVVIRSPLVAPEIATSFLNHWKVITPLLGDVALT